MARILFVHAAAIEGRGLAAVLAPHPLLEIGVGSARAAMNLTRALALGAPPDLVVALGVCGAYPERVAPGAAPLAVRALCVVTSDRFADEGVATEQGFLDLRGLGLVGEDAFSADAAASERVAMALGVPRVAGATVSTCSGQDARAAEVATRSRASVETMEGAAIALVCARHGLPWLAVRAVSNLCGDRARGGWDLAGALAALHAASPRVLAAL